MKRLEKNDFTPLTNYNFLLRLVTRLTVNGVDFKNRSNKLLHINLRREKDGGSRSI
jgi:hypothetical protein